MNQLRPYWFWIVSGVLLLACVVAFFFPPTTESGDTADLVKQQLDEKRGDWEKLRKRAQLDMPLAERGPRRAFDPEREGGVLASSFLVTPAWMPVLQDQIRRYDEQFGQIRTYLAQRSAMLHQRLIDTKGMSEWYDEYQRVSSDLLARLIASGHFVPEGAGAPDLRTDSALRGRLDLYTRGAELPTEAEWDRIAYRLRVAQAVADRLAGVRAATTANPIVQDVPAAADAATGLVPRIVRIEISDQPVPLGGEVGTYADGVRCTVTLDGALPAVAAASAAFEQVGDDDRPLFVVLGGRIARRDAFAVGERKDVAYETVSGRMDLLLLDFNKAGAAP